MHTDKIILKKNYHGQNYQHPVMLIVDFASFLAEQPAVVVVFNKSTPGVMYVLGLCGVGREINDPDLVYLQTA